ncbi:MAG: insulinase family protein [Magnetococcales bacterium]|nr:insulinase family protein [Magnetococcales bacterium]
MIDVTRAVIAEPHYRTTMLANSLTVSSFPMPWLHEVGAVLLVRAGSRYEAEQEAGMAHFLEHMLFKGTDQIADPGLLHAYLESMAANMNASTGPEYNLYWITLPPEYLDEGFLTFCSMFTAPAFAHIEVERQVVIAEMREDENERGEITVPNLLAGHKLWPGHPLARSVLGQRETIQRMRVADLRRFLERCYCGCNTALAFFGPVEHQSVVALSQQALGHWPTGELNQSPEPPAMADGPHWIAVDDPTAQLTLTLFFRADGFRSPLFLPLSALRRLLDDGFSSRLQATVREQQGLVYHIWSAYTAFSDAGSFEIGASVAPENLTQLFAELMHHCQLLCHTAPDADEWQRLLTRWYSSLRTSLDHPLDLIERYVSDHLFQAVEPLSVSWEQVRQLQPQQLLPIARQILCPSRLVTVLVGPQATSLLDGLKQQLDQLGTAN